MNAGEIYYACTAGHYVLKFVGDVRLTLCATIDEHLDVALTKETVIDAVVDLTETVNIDSTSLGMIAKLANKCQQFGLHKPTLVCNNSDVKQILLAMGFDEVFVLADQVKAPLSELEKLPFVNDSESKIRERIISAHKLLIDLNENNRLAFKDLVETLENCSHE